MEEEKTESESIAHGRCCGRLLSETGDSGNLIPAFAAKACRDQARVSRSWMYLCAIDLEESILWCIGKW